ncbi:MFS transporter [Pseudarthrobacter sulfonivorans]|uniref:MFS transporter n=1 Tax=Pseudarthrobacter sulfonivorans TaxID=121292 RepID=UPI0027856605|nr:MFS transporter [Pseudarthrobacter sulfonivorans]MDP9998445.1 MFS family permease [Pseudarthrobacter sulfonivorans]
MKSSYNSPRSGAFGAVAGSVALTAVSVSPVFLVGAVAVQMRSELQFDAASIGLVAAIMFGTGGLLARPAGGLVQKIGSRWGTIAAAGTSMFAFLGIGMVQDLAGLAICLAVAGIGNALSQPSTNLRISLAIARSRLGLAMGIKQASIPLANLLGGLAIPGIVLTLGWRWAFLLAVPLALLVALLALLSPVRPVQESDARAHKDPGTPRLALVMLSAGGGLAAGAATSLGIFFVASSVSSGISPASAGYLFALLGLLGLASRIGLGALADRMTRVGPYRLASWLMFAGATGFFLQAVGETPLIIIGAVVGYMAGWAWPGLLHYGVVRDSRQSAASATGALQVGLSLGAALGPLSFGMLAAANSYALAWTVAGTALLTASLLVGCADRLITGRRSPFREALPGTFVPAGHRVDGQ